MNEPDIAQERSVAASLVARVRNGDRQAEAELVTRYTRGLRFVLRRRVGDRPLAEDLLQETWSIALQRLRRSGLDEPERLAGYLAGIANHLATGDQRRVVRQRTAVDSDLIELVPDEQANPFQQVSRAEVRRHVRALLDELPQARDREILTRFYVEEEDKADICTALGVDSVHFNRVLFRARQRLRELVVQAGLRGQMSVAG